MRERGTMEGEGEWNARKPPLVETAFRLPGNGRHQTPRLAQDPHTLPGRRMEHSPRGGIDEQTLEIRAAEFTTSDVGDVEPVNATGSGEPARHAARTAGPDPTRSRDRQRHRPLSRFASKPLPAAWQAGLHAEKGATDGAYDTRKCHDAIAARGAAAIIPPRKNAKPWKPDSPGALARNEALRASKRFGRTIWRRWSGYHRRSRVEI